MAAILRIKDNEGNWIDVPAMVGPQGPAGEAGIQGEKGEKGEKGAAGADGLTPFINAGGNWQIGENDTGIKAVGVDGTNGDSAYDVAKKNGFVGTEEEWLASLSSRKWKHLRDVKIDSNLSTIMSTATGTGTIFSFSTDENGKPFSCTEFFIVFAGKPAFTNDYYAPLCVANLQNSDFSKIGSTNCFKTMILSGDGNPDSAITFASGTVDIVSNTVINSVGRQLRYIDDDYAAYFSDIHIKSFSNTDNGELVPWTNLAIGIWDPNTQAMSTQYGFIDGSVFWIYGR